ncbi:MULTISPECIES: phage tail protein [unclassified Terrabacter]|uniref:phage tail protein n=1 Tax=unclassified Terrabacter TaxID=2630222 RepID=UPI0006FB25A0|nr:MULTISPECIES: tail fiber protein [unclassified Terrabacter]KRB47097.1 phage tail protein [Terrabacter sp. Root181]KRF38918.1 phage tail protein [Terrabacter sp. Soil810]
MSEPYIGEIRLFGGTFAPVGWLACNGQLLPIGVYDALFNLIGTTYGGDGQTTFAVPDLRGRIPVHADGSGYVLGQSGGVESVTLTTSQMPAHTHPVMGSSATASVTSATGNVPATTAGVTVFAYGTDQPHTTLHPSTVAPSGGFQPHDNMQPYLCITFIIATEGIYPSQN